MVRQGRKLKRYEEGDGSSVLRVDLGVRTRTLGGAMLRRKERWVGQGLSTRFGEVIPGRYAGKERHYLGGAKAQIGTGWTRIFEEKSCLGGAAELPEWCGAGFPHLLPCVPESLSSSSSPALK